MVYEHQTGGERNFLQERFIKVNWRIIYRSSIFLNFLKEQNLGCIILTSSNTSKLPISRLPCIDTPATTKPNSQMKSTSSSDSISTKSFSSGSSSKFSSQNSSQSFGTHIKVSLLFSYSCIEAILVFNLQLIYSLSLYFTAWMLSGSWVCALPAPVFFTLARFDMTRVEFTVPLRESFALPFWALQLAILTKYFKQNTLHDVKYTVGLCFGKISL